MKKATLFYPSGCIVGEGPLWHAERKSLFWVDIEGRAFYELGWGMGADGGNGLDAGVLDGRALGERASVWQMDPCVSVVVPTQDPDQVLLGVEGGVMRFCLSTGEQSRVTDLGLDWKGFRCNDGKCDDQGRLWIGTTDMKHREGAGALYCVDGDGGFRKILDGQTIANGMAWSPDHRKFYYTDSVTRKIGCYRYEAVRGTIEFERTAIIIPPEMGVPDGMAMDGEGMLWIALWGGYGVGRWDPDSGSQLDFVEVAAPQVSSCAFIGEGLDRLLITTARRDLDEATMVLYPGSGHVFIVDPGVRGMVCGGSVV